MSVFCTEYDQHILNTHSAAKVAGHTIRTSLPDGTSALIRPEGFIYVTDEGRRLLGKIIDNKVRWKLGGVGIYHDGDISECPDEKIEVFFEGLVCKTFKLANGRLMWIDYHTTNYLLGMH